MSPVVSTDKDDHTGYQSVMTNPFFNKTVDFNQRSYNPSLDAGDSLTQDSLFISAENMPAGAAANIRNTNSQTKKGPSGMRMTG
jgi:hypothetical protein